MTAQVKGGKRVWETKGTKARSPEPEAGTSAVQVAVQRRGGLVVVRRCCQVGKTAEEVNGVKDNRGRGP